MALKTTVGELVGAARARITEIETEDGFAMVDDPNVVIVDIREAPELAKNGKIPGSVHAPRSQLEFLIDPTSPAHNPALSQEGKRYVFHCAAGGRSALSVAMLQDLGFEAAHLKNGFGDWVKKGGPVDPAE